MHPPDHTLPSIPQQQAPAMPAAAGGSPSHAAAVRDGVRGALGRLTLLAGVQAFALVVFMLGFFLTRQEVPHHSHCQDAALWKEAMPAAAAVSEEGGENASACWAPPRFKRAVIVVIDALRFDFVAPVDEGEDGDGDDRDAVAQAARARRAKTGEMYHINKLPVVRELLHADPSRALLYRFEADPPTTTMQRLKGLTTGSLPTFLDLRQNFHSPAVAEDSLIQQLRQQDKRLTAMGDDTWQLLFPNAFHRSFPFPSFNTRDLHTVDDGVLQHLLPEMALDDWDVLIAHFLGVDHVGHTFGPSHPAMAAKLGQMDTAIRGVLEALGDDSLLLLMGDHGMTDDGNHGGATREETEAALFLYSRGEPLAQQHPADSSVLLWRDDDDDGSGWGGHGLTPHHLQGQAVPRRMAQVDLVPTLALLLGTAVPYASLGGIVPELFFHPPPANTNTNATATVVASYRALARRFRANAAQVHRYLLRYAELASLPQQELASLSALHDAARAAHDSEESSSNSSGQEEEGEEEETKRRLARACALYRRFLRGALELGRRVWTRYDVGLMLWSLALLAASLLWGLATAWEAAAAAEGTATPSGRGVVATAAGSRGQGHAQHSPPSPTDLTAAVRWTLAGVGATLLLSGCFPVHFLQAGNDHAAVVIPALLFTLVLAGLSLPALAARVVAGWRRWRRRQGKAKEDKGRRWQGSGIDVATAVSLALVALHGDSLFSNSFIEAEERVVLFLGATAAAFAALALTEQEESSDSNRGEATSLPSLAQQHLQALLPGLCTRLAFAVKGHGQDVAAHFHPLATTVPLLALLLGYRHTPGRRRGRGRVLGLGAAYALVLLHWAAQVDDDEHRHDSPYLLRLLAPRAIYLGSALALSYLLLARTRGGTAAALCLDLAAAISPALLLVLGPAVPLSLLCQAGAVVALTRLFTHRSHHHSSSSSSSSSNSSSRRPATLSLPETVALSFLGRASFFATGHHTQFSRLQYSAAFVGLDDFDFIAGGALLFLNTFGTELLSLLLTGYYAAATTTSAEGDDALARVTSTVGGLLGLSALRTFLTSLCVLVQRRHLMVWAIFAPKFIFDAALHVVLSVGGVGLLWALAWRGRGGEGGAKNKKTKL